MNVLPMAQFLWWVLHSRFIIKYHIEKKMCPRLCLLATVFWNKGKAPFRKHNMERRGLLGFPETRKALGESHTVSHPSQWPWHYDSFIKECCWGCVPKHSLKSQNLHKVKWHNLNYNFCCLDVFWVYPPRVHCWTLIQLWNTRRAELTMAAVWRFEWEWPP